MLHEDVDGDGLFGAGFERVLGRSQEGLGERGVLASQC